MEALLEMAAATEPGNSSNEVVGAVVTEPGNSKKEAAVATAPGNSSLATVPGNSNKEAAVATVPGNSNKETAVVTAPGNSSLATVRGGWENTLSKIALNIFSSRAKVLAKDAPLSPIAETTDDSGGRLSSESPGFDHHKVAQDIFR